MSKGGVAKSTLGWFLNMPFTMVMILISIALQLGMHFWTSSKNTSNYKVMWWLSIAALAFALVRISKRKL